MQAKTNKDIHRPVFKLLSGFAIILISCAARKSLTVFGLVHPPRWWWWRSCKGFALCARFCCHVITIRVFLSYCQSTLMLSSLSRHHTLHTIRLPGKAASGWPKISMALGDSPGSVGTCNYIFAKANLSQALYRGATIIQVSESRLSGSFWLCVA